MNDDDGDDVRVGEALQMPVAGQRDGMDIGFQDNVDDAIESPVAVSIDDDAPQFGLTATDGTKLSNDPSSIGMEIKDCKTVHAAVELGAGSGSEPEPESSEMEIPQSQEEMEDPDWEIISRHEPAASDAPLFLAARDKRYATEARFAAALDDAHEHLKLVCDEILGVAADVYNNRREKLDAMETEIKQDFVENEEKHSLMSKKLEEFARKAQAQFQELAMRLANGKGSSQTL